MTDRIIVRAGLARCGQIDAEIEELQSTRDKFAVMQKDYYVGYQKNIDQLTEISKYIVRQVDSLYYTQKQAIKLHFLHGCAWELVAQQLNFSNSRVRTIATEGLDALIEPLKRNPEVWKFCVDSVKL